jgi:hypothetical protein
VPATSLDTVVAIGGPTSTAATTVPGQNAIWSFAGAAGQRVYVTFTGGTFGSLLNTSVTVRKPEGATLATASLCGVSRTFDTLTLPRTARTRSCRIHKGPRSAR